jgi:hypothetical protein
MTSEKLDTAGTAVEACLPLDALPPQPDATTTSAIVSTAADIALSTETPKARRDCDRQRLTAITPYRSFQFADRASIDDAGGNQASPVIDPSVLGC